MSIRRLGVLKTGDMMKISEKFNIDEHLAELLAENKANAEVFQRIEIISKKALGKLSEDADDIEIKYSGYMGYEDSQGKSILKELGLDENDELLLKIIRYAVGYRAAQVISAPKSRKSDINRLNTAVRNAKRELKTFQKNIYDDLRKLEKLQQKIQMVVDTIMSEEMAKGLWFDNHEKKLHKSSPNSKKLERYQKSYKNLVSKIIDIKNDIRDNLKKCRFKADVINKIYNDIKYPMYDIGKLREMKEEMTQST